MATSKTVNIIIKAFDQTKSGLTMPIKNLKDLGDAVDKLKPAMAAMGAAAGAAFGAFAVGAVQSAEAMRRMQTAMTVATGDARLAGEELLFVRDAAMELGLDLQTSAAQFAKISAAAIGTKMAGQGVRDIFLGVSQATTALGLSQEDAEGALRAISQMMSKGVVSMEELRQQLGERLPGAYQAAARASGLTTAEFSKQVAEGKILAEDFLPKFAAELQRTFGGAAQAGAESLTANLNRLKNVSFELSVVYGQAFLPVINQALTSFLEFEKRTGTFAGTINTLVAITKGFIGAFITLVSWFKMGAQVVAIPLTGALIVFDGVIRGIGNQFKVLGGQIDAIITAFKALGDTAGDIGEVIDKAFSGDMAGMNVALDKATKNWDARLATLKTALTDLGAKSGEALKADFDQTMNGLRVGFENAEMDIEAGATALIDRLMSLYSNPIPVNFQVQTGGTGGGSRVTGEGKFEARTGKDDESSAIDQRIKDLETFAEMRRKFAEESDILNTEGYDRERVMAMQAHDEKLRQIYELSLTEEEQRIAREEAEMAHQARLTEIKRSEAQAQIAIERHKTDAMINAVSGYAALAAAFGKKGLAAYKAIAISQAIISTFVGANRAMADWPWPMNIVIAGSIVAQGMANVAQIKGQAHSGMDYIPSEGSYRLSKGEMVVDPGTSQGLRQMADDYQQGASPAGGMMQVNVTLDGRTLGSVLLDMSKNGTLELDSRAIRTA